MVRAYYCLNKEGNVKIIEIIYNLFLPLSPVGIERELVFFLQKLKDPISYKR